MNSDMPISMFLEGMTNDLMGVIEKYSAHPSITRLVVKEVYDQVCSIAMAHSRAEKEEYEKKMQSSQTAEKEGDIGE